MQLIRYEIRKLTSKRNLLIAILLLLFATFTFLYMEQLQSDDVMAKHKDVYFIINKYVISYYLFISWQMSVYPLFTRAIGILLCDGYVAYLGII